MDRAVDPRKVGILDAAEALFAPLTQLLLAHGISSPEAESLLRAVFVHEAAKADATRRKRPNVSRVALIASVDRAEVTRILRGPPRADPGLETRRQVNRVLAGWHSDRDFVDEKRPMLLQVKARERRRPTFWRLVNRYAPGVYPGLVLNELVRVRAVRMLKDGRVRVRMRRYRTGALSDQTLREIGSRARDLMRTMVISATESAWPHTCQAVETVDIDPAFLPLIRKMFVNQIDAMMSGMQEALRSSRWRRTRATARRVRIGVTAFSHEEELTERMPNEGTKRESSSSRIRPRTHRRR
jgi:Family of unknown function (DUF6502)